MERNLMGELSIYRQTGVKPNFSDIARRYGLDRHTVARHWAEGEAAHDGREDRVSAFDEVRDVILEKAALPGITKRAIHEYLLDRREDLDLPGYNAFTQYCRSTGILVGRPAPEAHPRYETAPGVQLQFDWKEDLSMRDRHGREWRFHVFTATLSWSRLHVFVYVTSRTTDALLGCLVETFKIIGGVPEECLTDNMSALVVVSGGRRRKVERAWRFAREAGFRLVLCAPRSPETKGKDESANRFVNRLLAYDGDFEGEAELLEIIARLQARCNAEPNGTTGLPPATLFMREKEHLRPVGNARLLEEMVGDVRTQVVPPTMLVRAAGGEWSVPRRCVGRRVTVTTMPGGQIRVTMAGELVAVHDASGATGRINYTEDHYAEAIADKRAFADRDILEAARANLDLLDGVGGGL